MIEILKRVYNLCLNNIPLLNRLLNFSIESASINITDRCCLRCEMCNQWQKPTVVELNTEQWKHIINELADLGIRDINFAGGEPLLRKDLPELIRTVSDLSMIPAITTNGILLNDEILNSLMNAGLKRISISLDAADEAYDHIRGVQGSYKKVLNSLKLLSGYHRQEHISVHIYFLLMKHTLAGYKKVFSLADELNLPIVVNLLDHSPYFFQLQKNKDNFKIGEDELKDFKEFQKVMVQKKEKDVRSTWHYFTDIAFFHDYMKDSIQKLIPCFVSQKRLFFGPDGSVYPGCWSSPNIGNAMEQPLKQILQSKKYKSTVRKLFSKNCPGCSCGYATNIRYHIPHILKEIYYRINSNSRKSIFELQDDR